MTGGVFPLMMAHGFAERLNDRPLSELQETFEQLALNTKFGVMDVRYLWYGPIGNLRINKEGTMVTDDINGEPVVYRALNEDEQLLWLKFQEAFKP